VFTDILQPTHLLFVLVVALLVLGPKRLPEVARSLGSGLRDFRNAISGESHDDRSPAGAFASDHDEDDEEDEEASRTPAVRELEPGTHRAELSTTPAGQPEPEPVPAQSNPPRVQEVPAARTAQPAPSSAPAQPAPSSAPAQPAPSSAPEPPASS
jgi:TatA/E family protein of Tat protein translocase